MFIVHLKSGKTIVEGKDARYWDDVPDGITSLEITFPIKRQHKLQDGTMIDLPSPTIKLGRYDAYYCAYQAVAKIMTFGGMSMEAAPGGEGTITHQIMAGIDHKREEVVYIELNVTTMQTQVQKFDLKDFKVAPHSLKLGAK